MNHNITHFLLNKFRKMSLKSEGSSRTFVSSNNQTTLTMLTPHQNTRPFCLQLLLMVTGLFVSMGSGVSQGFEVYFGGNAEDQGEIILPTADGGYLLAGYSESYNDGDLDVLVIKADEDGRQVWLTTIDNGFTAHAYGGITTTNNTHLLVGDFNATPQANLDAVAYLIGDDGALLWEYRANTGTPSRFNSCTEFDGKYALIGEQENAANGDRNGLIVILGGNGTELDRFIIAPNNMDVNLQDILVTNNSFYIVGGRRSSAGGSTQQGYLARYSDQGILEWEVSTTDTLIFGEERAIILATDGALVTTGFQNNRSDLTISKWNRDGTPQWRTVAGGGMVDQGNDVVETPDGGFAAVGFTEKDVLDINAFLVKVDANGNINFSKNYGRSGTIDVANSIFVEPDGTLIIGGTNALTTVFFNDFTLLKTDALGNFNSTYFTGQIFFDTNNDCTFQFASDQNLEGWIVEARGAQHTFYGTTDANGRYTMLVDTGRYDLSILPRNAYWEPCVAQYNNVAITGTYDSLAFDFALTANIDCPAMEVDLGTPQLTTCESATYFVSYRNWGTAAANAEIVLTLDTSLTYVSASIPATPIGNTVRFDLGNQPVGSSGQFSVTVDVACQRIPGSIHLAEAHIFPDTLCVLPDPSWDQAFMRANARCDGDSVRFSITNQGDGLQNTSLQYIVVEDQVLILSEPFGPLNPNDSLVPIALPANGATYRIIAEQTPGTPFENFTTRAVEGCVGSSGNIPTVGAYTQFAEAEAAPFVAIEALENSLDSTGIVLRAFPKGYRGDTITATTDLEYHLYWKNTTDRTLEHIIIRNDLSPALNVATIEWGSASHTYVPEIYQDGRIRLAFDSLGLAPNEVVFVKYRINQQAANSAGTVIDNQYELIVDGQFNAQSSTVRRVVGGPQVTDFVEVFVNSQELVQSEVELIIQPNPFVETATLKLMNYSSQKLTLRLYDNVGRIIDEQKGAGSEMVVRRGTLPTGLYRFVLFDDGQRLVSGALIAH